MTKNLILTQNELFDLYDIVLDRVLFYKQILSDIDTGITTTCDSSLIFFKNEFNKTTNLSKKIFKTLKK